MAISEKILIAIKEADTLEELKKIVNENKVEISDEKLEQVFNQYHTSGELSDQELENVTGGCNTYVTPDDHACNDFLWWLDHKTGYISYVQQYGMPYASSKPAKCGICAHMKPISTICGTEYYCELK